MANQTLLPMIPEEAKIDWVRIEKNLAAIGFFGAHNRRDNSSVRQIVVRRPGSSRDLTVTIQAPQNVGLPNAADQDKYLAFMKILMEDRIRSGKPKIENPIRINAYRLLMELGISDGSANYEEIARWGNRMTATSIHSKEVIFSASSKTYIDDTLHIFRRFARVSRRKKEDERTETYEVMLEDWILENLNHSYMIPQNFDAYKRLSRPTAKCLFERLMIWFYASNCRTVEKEYADLCQLLNVKKYRFEAKIRETMGAGLDELVYINYLKWWKLERMLARDGFKLILEPGDALIAVMDLIRKNFLLSQQQGTASQVSDESLLEQLRSIGISKRKAQQIASSRDAERLRDQVEYVLQQIAEKGEKLSNPAGYAISILDEDRPLPPSFVPSRVAQKMESQDESAEEKLQRERYLFQSFEEWRREKILEHMQATFTDEQLSQRIQEVLPKLYTQFPSLRRMPVEKRMAQGKEYLIREFASLLTFPTFEEWMASSDSQPYTQPTLFPEK
jgi:hypothetical protein